MPKIEIKLGPPKGGMMGKLGEMAEQEPEEETGSEDELLDAVYDAIEAKDREGFKESLCALIECYISGECSSEGGEY